MFPFTEDDCDRMDIERDRQKDKMIEEEFIFEQVYRGFCAGKTPESIAYDLGISVEEVFRVSNQIEQEMEDAYNIKDYEPYIDSDYYRDQMKYGEL